MKKIHKPNALARALTDYFYNYLPCLRRMSQNTIHNYRDSFVLLLKFLAKQKKSSVVELDIEDINAEPGCMDTLGSSFTDKESRIFKIGEEDKGLTIEFNGHDRTAEIKGKEPIQFYYFIQVRRAKDPSKWCYAGGENRNETKSITGELDSLVDKVLFALYGVEA